MRRSVKLMLPILALCLAVAGCGTGGLDYMIEEYNSRFGIHDDTLRLKPGDLGYDQSNMISPEYHVGTRQDLSIPAPDVQDATYLWTAVKDTGETVEIRSPTRTERHLKLYIPDSGLSVGTYYLTLTLTVAGTVCTDTAKVTVYTENP